MPRVLIGTLVLGAFVAVSFAATFAQTAPSSMASPAASPAASPSPTATPTPPWSISGFGDATYTKPLPTGGTFLFTNGSPDRVFDGITGINTKAPVESNFVPNNLNFNIRKNTSQGLGGDVEVSLGSDANVIASYGGAAGTYTDITQANLYYATGPWTLTAGKFETLAGYEVIENPNNNQISRSILFGFAIPFTHTGVRLQYAPSKWTFTAGANFGWDQIIQVQGGSTLEGGVTWTPSTIFSLSGDVYNGREPSVLTPYPNGATIAPPPSPTAMYAYPFGTITGTIFGTRTLVDLVAHWNPSTVLNFGANYDTAQQTNDQSFTSTGALVTNLAGAPIQGTSKWNGFAGYAVWNVNSHVTVSGRYESFDDANGVRTGFAQTWDEGTATLQFVPQFAPSWKARLEYRADWSNQPVFARYTSPMGTAATNNSSIAAEVLFTWP